MEAAQVQNWDVEPQEKKKSFPLIKIHFAETP
jgi:hypothetical protein